MQADSRTPGMELLPVLSAFPRSCLGPLRVILWLFTSIPVVTIGASTTAAYSVALKLAAS